MGELNIKLPRRIQDSNKSTYGRVLNIAGSKLYTGAAYLSSASALKVGCGYLNLACIDFIIPIVSSMLPEAVYTPLLSVNGVIAESNKIENIKNFDVISIGCGLTFCDSVVDFFKNTLSCINKNQVVIIDADGINILSKTKINLNLDNLIITPHPKELSRLLEVNLEEILINREKYARAASQKYNCITVLKGHETIITDGEKLIVNHTGNSSLSKAGTGDVLTGIIAGLCAQKMNLFDAAVLGVYLHGLSSEIASKDLTQYSVMASDIIKYLPCAIKKAGENGRN